MKTVSTHTRAVPERREMQHVPRSTMVVLLTTIVVTTIIGPGLADRVTARLGHRTTVASTASVPTTVNVLSASPTVLSETVIASTIPVSPTTQPTATVAPTTVAPSTVGPSTIAPSTIAATTARVPTTTPVSSTPASSQAAVPTTAPVSTSVRTATPTTVAPTTGAEAVASTVIAVQTVPAVRDFIFEIDGRRVATDRDGRVAVASGDRIVSVVGIQADPALQLVDFASWGDGDTHISRALNALGGSGPVAQVGVSIRSRVVVRSGQPNRAGSADFASTAGTVHFDLNQPRWVLAARAVVTSGGFFEERLTYTLKSVTFDGTDKPVPTTQQFTPTPEALWLIT